MLQELDKGAADAHRGPQARRGLALIDPPRGGPRG
jgi:hypothetical protein